MNHQEDGNNETTNGRHDEQWDLTSPLLLQSNNSIKQEDEYTNQCSLIPTDDNDDDDDDNEGDNNMNQQLLQHSNNYMGEEGEEGGEEEEEDAAVLITADKNEYYQTLLAAIFTMSFIILVSGSYFFEWSDTVLKVQMNQLLARTTRNDDDDAYTNNNVTSDDNINIRADGDENKFDFGETMSVDLPLYTDATFQTTIGVFQSSHSNVIVFLIITSCVVAPALYMILQPIIIYVISNVSSSTSTTSSASSSVSSSSVSSSLVAETNGKNWIFKRCNFFKCGHHKIGKVLVLLEFMMKFSMTLIFVNSILAICTSQVKFIIGGNYAPTNADANDQDSQNIENDNPMIAYVMSNSRGGLISYLIGLSFFGIGSLSIMRKRWNSQLDRYVIHHHYHDEKQQRLAALHHNNDQNSTGDDDDQAVLLALNQEGGRNKFSPPPSAFLFRQHPDYFMDTQSVLSRDDDNIIKEASSMDGNDMFKDDGVIAPHSDDGATEELMAPLLSSNDNVQAQLGGGSSAMEDNIDQKKRNRPPIWDILQFECGLLSFILLFPISTLPLIRLEYEGLLTTILDPATLENSTLSLWDIISSIISTNNYGRDIFGLVSIMFFWINVLIIPTMTWILSAIVWFFSFVWRKESKTISIITTKSFSLLKVLQPFAFLTPFAVSLFVTVSSLQQVTDFLFNQNFSCKIIQNVLRLDEGVGECLLIRGHLLPGSYVLLLQGLFTDLFVILVTSLVK